MALKPIIKKLVAENPDERYEDISELKSALAGIQNINKSMVHGENY